MYLSCGEHSLHIFYSSIDGMEFWSPLPLTDTAGRATCDALSLQAAAVPRKLWKKSHNREVNTLYWSIKDNLVLFFYVFPHTQTTVYSLFFMGSADVLKLFTYNMREASQRWISEAGCTTCVKHHFQSINVAAFTTS